MTPEFVRANGVELCAETFGDPADPAILLIMGAASSMLWWEEEFCERLAAGRRFIIRYDHRDTGQSVTHEPGAPAYTFADLVNDVVGLLDAFRLARGHLVGMSMGGAIAQLAALEYPTRIESLTLISTSPAGPGEADLSPMSPELRVLYADAPGEPDWSELDAVSDYFVAGARPLASKSRPFDEALWRSIARRDFDRSINIASMTNHFSIQDGEPWRERLAEVRTPTLVIHGAEDPLFPTGHAHALANEIPGAELLVLGQTGHELPRAVWNVVLPALLRHTQ